MVSDADFLDELKTITVEQPDGSIDFEFVDSMEEPLVDLAELDHYENLATFLSPSELSSLSSDVLDDLDEDEASRDNHLKQLISGLDMLGLNDDNVEVPFEGACTVFHPLIMENAVKIQAKAEGELLPASGPVRTRILGTPDEKLEAQARRVKEHMNWQTTEEMPEFYLNTQRALLWAALFGDAFKKNYRDPVKGRVCDALISIDRLVVNSGFDSLESAERITEIQYISEREMLARQYSGLYRDDVELPEPYRIDKEDLGRKIDTLLGLNNTGEGYEIIEQHAFFNLPGFEHDSGVPLPYVVTLERSSGEVLAIRKNWKENGDIFTKREWFTHYFFVPGFSFYNLGYIHLLGNFQTTLTAIIRSLVDAGSFSNMRGGIKAKQLRILDDAGPIQPGEFRDAEFFGQDISKLIYPFEFKEPSGTLLSLLEWLEVRGQKYADSAEQVVADAANYGPVGTTMALLDASTKFFSTVFKRFHSAQKKQLRIIAELNYENLPDNPEGITFNIPGMSVRITKEDYSPVVDIIPVSDPNISSAAHRVTLASQKLQAALQSPNLHNLREAYKQYYIAMGDENYEKYLPAPTEPTPREPTEDIFAAIQGQPIKAFPDQDHEAHIAVKTAFINDPAVMAQQQLYAAAIPALQANIREHTVFRFSQQLTGGKSLGLNEQQAAQEIAQFNQFKAQNPLGMRDPKQLLAQAELNRQENEKRKLDIKEKEVKIDTLVDVAKLEVDMKKAMLQAKTTEDTQRFSQAVDLIKQATKN